MATFTKFEDIEAWQYSRDLAKQIFVICSDPPLSKDFALKNQILAASGSVMDNIAEGFGRGGRNEFVNFLSIASGSLNETKSQLYRALDRNYISEGKFIELFEIATQAGNRIGKLSSYLNQTEHKGTKFKNRSDI